MNNYTVIFDIQSPFNFTSQPVGQPSRPFTCERLYSFYLAYVEKALGIIGLILNLTCLYVFSRPCMHKNTNGYMTKYLLLKSIFDSFFFFRNSVYSFLDCKGCFLARSYSFKILFWIFQYYLGFIVQMLSMFCEVMANFDRYAYITNGCKLYKKSPYTFRFIVFLMILISSIIYIYKFLERDLVVVKLPGDPLLMNNSFDESRTEYHLKYNAFSNSMFILWVRFITSFLRDFLTSVIIFVLNIKTMNIMKQTIMNKRKLNSSSHIKITRESAKDEMRVDRRFQDNDANDASSTPKSIHSVKFAAGTLGNKKANASQSSLLIAQTNPKPTASYSKLNYSKVERNITIMVILNGFICIIGHFPFFIVFLPIRNFGQILGRCYSSVNYTLFYSSYSINFFIYFFFNKRFQNFIISKFQQALGLCHIKLKSSSSPQNANEVSYASTIFAKSRINKDVKYDESSITRV